MRQKNDILLQLFDGELHPYEMICDNLACKRVYDKMSDEKDSFEENLSARDRILFIKINGYCPAGQKS